jgi:hypothetical protein
MVLVVTLYFVLLAIAAFGPLRWSFTAFVLLATLDFPGNRESVGILNAIKGIALPIYLLWRLRGYSGHRRVILAPIAWGLLTLYAGIAAAWSLFPISALKLSAEMAGSLIICCLFLRATKAGYITAKIVLPVTVGALVIASLQNLFYPLWTGEPGRFTGFTTAQGFAAFLAALFCLTLCSSSLKIAVRVALCTALAVALWFNGSRIWFIGIVIAMFVTFAASYVRTWIKICVVGGAFIALAVSIDQRAEMIKLLEETAPDNRVAAAITAAYKGDVHSLWLGTFNFRKTVTSIAVERIQTFSLGELVFGRGTSNGAMITGSMFHAYAGLGDPNRMMHNEWVRVFYEWGIIGFLLWCTFLCSITLFALQGVRRDRSGQARALLAYLPALLVALAGENFLAGAGASMTMGFLLLIGIAAISHRVRQPRTTDELEYPYLTQPQVPARLAATHAG